MTPRDFIIHITGWNKAHEPKKAGSDAPSREEYEALKRRINGNQSK